MLSEKQNDLSQNPLLIEAARRLIARVKVEEANDPVKLAVRAGIKPDAWQADILRSRARETIMLVTRQGGKSTVSSIRALHRAMYAPRSLVLLLAPSYRQSKELFKKVREAHAAHPAPLPLDSESALEMTFVTGSRIVCLPGKEETIRGFSGVSLLIVDEASRVPDALYYAIRPMLAVSGGDIVLLSTPFGKRGFFFNVWTDGSASWHRVKVTALDCPRISKEWLEAERKAIGDFWYEQEYLCEFKEDVSAVFRYEDIIAASDSSITPEWSIRDALTL